MWDTRASHSRGYVPLSSNLVKAKSTDHQHLLELHPNSVYPGEWASTSSEDRAGYITLEKSDVYAATAQGAFELAGVDKAVKVS
jgi:hypothetical protein